MLQLRSAMVFSQEHDWARPYFENKLQGQRAEIICYDPEQAARSHSA